MSDHAYSTLLDVLDNAQPGASWSVDSWRTEADLAQLTGSERSEAQQQAVRDEYLTILGQERDGILCLLMRPSTAPLAKRRPVQVLERTAKRVQPVPVDAPGTLFGAWSA